MSHPKIGLVLFLPCMVIPSHLFLLLHTSTSLFSHEKQWGAILSTYHPLPWLPLPFPLLPLHPSNQNRVSLLFGTNFATLFSFLGTQQGFGDLFLLPLYYNIGDGYHCCNGGHPNQRHHEHDTSLCMLSSLAIISFVSSYCHPLTLGESPHLPHVVFTFLIAYHVL